jgi:hypothetical protein
MRVYVRVSWAQRVEWYAGGRASVASWLLHPEAPWRPLLMVASRPALNPFEPTVGRGTNGVTVHSTHTRHFQLGRDEHAPRAGLFILSSSHLLLNGQPTAREPHAVCIANGSPRTALIYLEIASSPLALSHLTPSPLYLHAQALTPYTCRSRPCYRGCSTANVRATYIETMPLGPSMSSQALQGCCT